MSYLTEVNTIMVNILNKISAAIFRSR